MISGRIDAEHMAAQKKAIVIGASADIGLALCHDWIKKGWEIYGTYRTISSEIDALKLKCHAMVRCDLGDKASVDTACSELAEKVDGWDVLVLAPGLQDPVNLFLECSIDEWADSIDVNFKNQVRIVHRLLKRRGQPTKATPTVLFFAGGGTNNATLRYSAYTISKIALIKMVELLAAEIPDVKFVIVGPGWVKTKIHNSTLKAGLSAGDNYERTIDQLNSDRCTPMEKVVDCCNSLISGSKELLTGRNFSVVFDKWGSEELNVLLARHPDMYKLRRHGNDF
jgi:NAD(P)-dependent dehydrogenase (short-subunit alcohol dehydrogenase family)